MSDSPDLPIASLRRLARGLVYDDARAEDVVQEAWLAALRRGPPPEGLRAWLAEAVRRIARSTCRDELRRTTREERAARPEALPSAAEASERIEILRRLLDAVDALDEPYRTAVVLRYFDELPPRTIAKRLGIPVNTARTHVRRGLERLRRQLAGERGRGRDELLAALVPLAGARPWRVTLGGPSPVLAALEIGVLAMKTPVGIGAVVALLAGAFWFLRGDPPREGGAERVAQAAPEGADSRETSGSGGAELQAASVEGVREPVAGLPLASASAWTVRGHVFKGRREAYANAELVGRVYAGTETEGTPLVDERFHADEHGDFAWSIAPPTETVAVRVEPVGSGQKTSGVWDVFLPGDPAPEQWYVNVFPFDGTLVGVVRDVRGNPIPGARLVHERFDEIEEIRADAGGRYSLPTSSARKYVELTVIAEGFALARKEVEELHPGEQTLDVMLEPERRAHGRVVDPSGAPVAGALVSASFPPELAATRTDAEGRFDVGVIDNEQGFGYQVLLWVIAPGFPTQQRSVGDLDEELEDEELELRLEHGVRLSGRVLLPDGSPAASTQVSVRYGMYPSNITYTDAGGRFELAPTWTGANTLWLWRRGFGQLRHDVDLPEGVPAIAGLELVLPPAHFLGGVVLDETGEPIPWAWVYVSGGDEDSRLEGYSTHADAEGRFLLEDLPDVPMSLGVQEEGCVPLLQPVAALDRDDVVLRVSRGGGLAGRVLDESSGAAIPSFTVRIASSEDGRTRASLPEAGRTFSDRGGEWRTYEQLPAGCAFTLEVSAPGYAPHLGRVVTSVERDPAACVVQLQRGGRVRGRVVDRLTQLPVAGARVERRSASERHISVAPLVTHTNDEGEFELADVRLGPMTLRVEASGGGAVDGPFEVSAGEPVERWIEIGSGGRLSGRLLDADGMGIAGVTVELLGEEVIGGNRTWSATSALDGSWAFAELPAGIFQLHWRRELAGLRANDLCVVVTLDGGEERRIDLQPRGGATLRGTVAVAEGALPGVVPMYLGPRRGNPQYPADGMRGTFAVNGVFEVPALDAGTWMVVAYSKSAAGESIAAHATLEIPAEGEVETHLVLQPQR